MGHREEDWKRDETVNRHFGHTSGRSVLGCQCVRLGCHNGKRFFSLDVGFHVSIDPATKHPNPLIGHRRPLVPEIALHPVRSFDQRSHEGSGLVFEIGFGSGPGTGMHFGLQIAV